MNIPPAAPTARRLPQLGSHEITSEAALKMARGFAAEWLTGSSPDAWDEMTAKAAVVTAWATLAIALKGQDQ